ncbi:alkaline phosphatase family protein [Cellulophaga sp. F20128]|uniref:alkaline phosphatase family protein n=1 Tax=Cellulophaga sp. F20128 TaxID=2926413 RepID=UPI001FF1BD08|nr:alkaline phosphatase family protein [Cellulophaga sp. F20128]MCK0155640.1 alkaline phosphatase family protein [Cellulophaga sp. F20128]
MIKKNSILVYTLLLVSSFVFSQQKNKKILFVIVDGISADVLEKIETPNLDTIARFGGYTRAYVGGEKGGFSQTPTISAVGYNSLLTGTWANKHNVWGNGIKNPNYKYWTIFRYVQKYKPKLKTAVFSTWLDNRTKLVGEGMLATGSHQLNYSFDGFELDTINFPHGTDRDYIRRIDEHVTNEATRYIKAESPDVSWVYLEYTDDMGHQFGDSEQFYGAIRLMDDQIGRLWSALQFRMKNHNEDWEIYITTDHGRNGDTGQGHGGQTDRERLTWMVTNAVNLNQYFKESQPAIVDILPTMLRSLNIKPTKAQLWEIDGTPITGKVSVTNAKAVRNKASLDITWTALDKNGKVKIWVSTTNTFAEGEKDNYLLLAKSKLGSEKVKINVSELPSDFYKIVVEGKHNSSTTWMVSKKEE